MDIDKLIHRSGHVSGHLKHRISLSANQIQGYYWVRIFSVLAPLEKRDVSVSWKISLHAGQHEVRSGQN